MSALWCDFETRSRCDLKAAGVYNYAQDASTTVLCMSWAFDDEPVVTWLPGQPFPARVANHTGQIRAHNAAFERLIFWYVLCPGLDLREPSLEQFYCTAAQARANCAPGSLEDVGRFAGASMKKDHRGGALIRALCIPRADGSFRDDPALMAEMVAYCEQDVRAMRAISKTQRELSDDELHAYHVNEKINDRGVRVDVDLCRAAVNYAQAELVEIQQIVREVTQGAITSVRSPKMRDWVRARVGPEALKLMTLYKDDVEKFSIDKSVRANLLVLAQENADEVPDDVAEVIQCADDLWASSVAKFSRASALADTEDRRVRGAFVFAGGSATGRASAFGLQVHNYPRKCAADPEAVRRAMVRGHQIVPAHGKRVTDVLKGMLRPMMLPAKGKHLVVADWSSIEGRVNPWLSMTQHGDAKLDVFRSGLDPYKVNAVATFLVKYDDVTGDQRQVGKVQELACGFGGSVGAFASMGKIYGINLPEEIAKCMVAGWRKANPWALPWWETLEKAYTRAMRNKGHEFSAGRVTYLFDGQHLWYALPSGRVLCYPFARFDDDEITYAKAAWKPSADASEWPRARLWRGLACIEKGTPVLTNRGWVPIQLVTACDLVWEGEAWVAQDGAVHQGVGRVMLAYGVSMTPDHKVLTLNGWVRADESERHNRAPCRLPNRRELDRVGWAAGCVAHPVRLRADARHEATELHEARSRTAPDIVWLSQERVHAGRVYDARDVVASSVRRVAVYARQVQATITSSVEKLRRARDNGLRGMGHFRGLLAGYGGVIPAGADAGPRGQRSGLQPSQLSVGDAQSAGAQQAVECVRRNALWSHDGFGVSGIDRARCDDAAVPSESRADGRAASGEAGRHADVYDLLNCGPRRRFVVLGDDGRPLIVHNCENVTQAAANDILRHSLNQLEREGHEVVLHVHDEIVCETADPDAAQEAMKRVMCTPANWAGGLPLGVEIHVMQRYGKG